jgi:Mrp family chromosome partitioning ATPase
MSAKDDARIPIHLNGQRRPVPPSRRLALALLGAFAGTVIACAVLATPTLLPMLPRYEAIVSTDRGPIAVRSASEDGARLAAAHLASGPDREIMAARRRIADRRANWADLPPGPLPPLAPEAEIAALLRARAEIGLTLAGEGAVLVLPARPGVDGSLLDRADRAVERAARTGDPQALRDALRSADLAEQRWLARESVASERMLRWQSRERSRAERFVLAAQVLESATTPFQRDLIVQWLPEFALDLESGALATLESAARESDHSEPRPYTLLWVSVVLFAAAAGSLLAYTLERATVRPRHRTLDRPLARTGDPGLASAARLHVVSGESAADVAAGAAQLAAPFIARGERVLILDGGRALRLHAPFGDQPRWGMSECVAGRAPLLGIVQRAIVSGLYLLPRGEDDRDLWPGATRLVDDALSHFARVILAVDAAGAAACGDALRGRWVEGWWTGAGAKQRRRLEAVTVRLGIAMRPFELELSPDRLLEELPRRVDDLRRELPVAEVVRTASAAGTTGALAARGAEARAAAPGEAESAALPPVATAPSAAATGPEREPLSPQVARVVETDIATRERLRFLMWMRRVQAERRKREIPSVA